MNTLSEIIIKPFGLLTVEEYHRITQAREAVFYLEQHVTCADADLIDLRSTFLWMEHEGRVVAFLRIIPAGVVYNEVSIGRVLVDTAYRRQGLCRRIMHEAMHYIAAKWGPQPVRLSAQLYLQDFYASLGFETVSEPYLEASIQHVKMLHPKVQ